MDVKRHRRERLEAAATRLGGKAALGRALGYVDGAFVGQMLRGERPVTEDTVGKVEALAGMGGWFGPQPVAEAWPFPLVKRERWETLTEQERGAVQAAMNRAIAECEEMREAPTNVRFFTEPGHRLTRNTSSTWKGRRTAKSHPHERATDKKGR